MFIADWVAALVTFACVAAVYKMIDIRSLDINWGSSGQAFTYQQALKDRILLLRLSWFFICSIFLNLYSVLSQISSFTPENFKNIGHLETNKREKIKILDKSILNDLRVSKITSKTSARNCWFSRALPKIAPSWFH